MDANRARYLRIAAILGVAAAGLAGLYVVMGRLVPGKAPPSEPATEIDYSDYLHPMKTERTARGEETAPFTGFAVSIDTDPPGAVVSVGGKLRGEAPVLADVTCSGDEKVEVRAEKPGFRPARTHVRCRTDTLVKVTLALSR